MQPEAHAAKARKIENLVALLRPSDYEMRIDGCMLAANHYGNLVLHVLGIRAPEDDIIHSEFLLAMDLTRLRVMAPEVLESLEGIEDLRAPYVRGGAPGGEEAGGKAIELLARCRKAALSVKPSGMQIVSYMPKGKS
jgi:hypothetical protein